MRQQAKVMLDIYPEYYHYRDDGCEVSHSCLKCPLPQCKYDDPSWYQREMRSRRDKEVLKVQQTEGLPVPQLAARFDLSQRTIFRILQRAAA